MQLIPNSFYLSHFNTSNQMENGAIKHIFETYLVRSDKVATIKSVWKKLQKILFVDQKYLIFFAVFLHNKLENSITTHKFNIITHYLPCMLFEEIWCTNKFILKGFKPFLQKAAILNFQPIFGRFLCSVIKTQKKVVPVICLHF